MREDLRDSINILTSEERKLVFFKLKEMVKDHDHQPASERPKRLVAYIKPNDSFDLNGMKSYLKDRLPDYMIPSTIAVVDHIPMLPNGKLDKKSLQLISPPQGDRIVETKKKNTKLEEQLVSIWEDVLNFKPIKTNDNFFEIGGDSILSIQIIAKARKLGMEISPNQLFDHQTISELALFVHATSNKQEDSKGLFTGELPLSPIQDWFFETHKNAPHYWNQSVQFNGLPPLTAEIVLQVMDALIAQHDAMRSSFVHKDGKWGALILAPTEIKAAVYIDVSNEDPDRQKTSVAKVISDVHSAFELSKGSLFKCVYINTGKTLPHTCLLIAHHLVVDFVSWQIFTNDFMTAMNQLICGNAIELPSRTTTIKDWGDYLHNFTANNGWHDELDFWKAQSGNPIPLPIDFQGHLPVFEKDVETIDFKLGKEIVGPLFTGANDTYGTKIDELVLAACVKTIAEWTKDTDVFIGMEKYGRESHFADMDISNTLGWFTAYFPLKFGFKGVGNIGANIISVKEQLRKVPRGGMGYGYRRYAGGSLAKMDYPEIVFNFLGVHKTSVLGQKVSTTTITKGARHPSSERDYLLEINAYIKDEELMMGWSYGTTFHKPSTIQGLTTSFEKNLIEIISHCSDTSNMTYTPSDFPDIEMDQDDLDIFINSLD